MTRDLFKLRTLNSEEDDQECRAGAGTFRLGLTGEQQLKRKGLESSS